MNMPILERRSPWSTKAPPSPRYPLRFRRIPTALLTGFLAFVVCCALAFLSVASYARKETLSGSVVPKAGLAPITTLEGGTVLEVLAQQGQTVRRGQSLAIISADKVISGGAEMGAILDQANVAQSQAVGRQAQAEAEILRSSLADAGVRQQELKHRRELLQNDLKVATERAKLSQDRVDRASGLAAQGYVSQIQLQTWRDAALQTQLAVSSATQALDEVDSALGRLRAETTQTRLKAQQAQAVYDSNRASLQERRAGQLPQQRVIVTSSVDGRIATLMAKPGGMFPSGAELGAIIPKDSPLEVELIAPSKAVGFIRPGTPVKLMYDAFPYQSFGMASGKVVRISEAPTQRMPTEAQAGQGASSGSGYAVRVALDAQSVQAYGKAWPLMPGMNVSAIVVLERRSALAWLLDPVVAFARRTKA